MYVLICICAHLVSERAPTRRLPPTSPSLAGWPEGAGKEGPAQLFLSSPLAAARVEAWLEGLLLLLALAGPAGDLKNALLPRRLGLPCGSGTGGAPTAAAESHRCWTAAGTYVRAGLYLYTFDRRTCADSTTLSYLAVSGVLAGGMRGKRARASCAEHKIEEAKEYKHVKYRTIFCAKE